MKNKINISVEEAILLAEFLIQNSITLPKEDLGLLTALREDGKKEELMQKLFELNRDLEKNVIQPLIAKVLVYKQDRELSLRQQLHMVACRVMDQHPDFGKRYVTLQGDEFAESFLQSEYPDGLMIDIPTNKELESCRNCIATKENALEDLAAILSALQDIPVVIVQLYPEDLEDDMSDELRKAKAKNPAMFEVDPRDN